MKYSSSPASGRLRQFLPLALTLVLLLIFSETLVHLLTESWWFSAIGFEAVFWTRLKWQASIWGLTFGGYAAFLWGNYLIAQRLTRDRPYVALQRYSASISFTQAQRLPQLGAALFILVLALFAALTSALAWETILKFLNPTAFEVADPIFQQDVGFYLFKLPFYQGLQQGLLGLLLWSLALSTAVYALKGEIRPERGWKYFLTGHAKAHLCMLLAMIAVAVAARFVLERYNLLYSPTGAVFGAGYTDVHARLQAYWMMGFVTLAVAGLFIISLWRSGFSLPIVGIVLYLLVLLSVNGVYPWFQQRFIVEPNELEKERPYIANNIEFTRQAYGLGEVQTEPFPAEEALDAAALQRNQVTLRNIRLWDYRPLLDTYRQLQEIRLYYRFLDVDVDRYLLNGDYRQVALSAREIAYGLLDSAAQTWVNQRLKFTHGYGLVMSPVNRVTSEGQPELFIKNIPPESTVDLAVDQPRIYYGEDPDLSYIFTGTNTDEFDYPQGDENALYRYDGEGGVPIGSWPKRLAYAYDLGSLKVLISGYFTPTSRIHYYRRVQERIRHVAPFLTLDRDPYLAIINGRLQWIVDAYTSSNRYPYSQPIIGSTRDSRDVARNLPLAGQRTNYVRDSVKVLLDAYDGALRFFAIDESDPVLTTYRTIFPTLFEAASALPAEVNAHLRYPIDLFLAQAQMYRAYHMANPDVFYNREDLWQFPTQVYENDTVRMDPYYVIMQLPGADEPEFIQIVPFTPPRKDNMVAWIAGRSNGDVYGRLLLYEFPKQELIYGPRQIEARIDQTPEISAQLTLWNQQGSSVIRGDLLVIPIEESLLYVEPVYLRAEQAKLPELRRVIMAYGNQVVMRETLEACFDAIFGEGSASAETTVASSGGADASGESAAIPADLQELVQSALEAYEEGQAALREGDWQRYGEAQRQLGEALEQLDANE